MLPKVGQTVLISFGSKDGPQGFNGKITNRRRIVQKIARVYEGGMIGTSSNDVWNVKPFEGSAADFTAIASVDI